MSLESIITRSTTDHLAAFEAFFRAETPALVALAQQLASAMAGGGKLLLCGNGGSACDAMHIAGEFVGRFKAERQGMAAIALSADSGILTAVGNDYGFERIYARQVEALGNTGDWLIGLSTSGSSANILAALEQGRAQGLNTLLFTGEKGRHQTEAAHSLLVVPSDVTAHVQEVQLAALHMLTEMAETLQAEAL